MQWPVTSGQWPVKRSQSVGFNWPVVTDHWPLFLSNYFRGNSLRGKSLDHIANLDVAIIRDRDAALHAICNLFGIVLEAPQRSNFTFEHLHVIAQQAHFGVALDQTITHATAGHRPNFRDAEHVQHLSAALVVFLEGGFEQAAHRT